MYYLFLTAAVLASILNTIQAGADGQLTKSLGSAMVGCLLIDVLNFIVLVAIVGVGLRAGWIHWPPIQAWKSTPWWAYTGGFFGLLYVLAMFTVARPLGSAVFMSVTLAAAMVTSVILDHYGAVGFEVRPITLMRVAGCVLLTAGTALVVKF